jgi:hypothetical protein
LFAQTLCALLTCRRRLLDIFASFARRHGLKKLLKNCGTHTQKVGGIRFRWREDEEKGGNGGFCL